MIPPERILEARILVVDDEQVNLDLIAGMLARAGYRSVACVRDSREAADRYASFRPDLVLLDLGMPNLDGFGVLERLASVELPGQLFVLVLTGFTDPATRLRALASGAKDFLNKPFDSTEALARIRNLLETRLLHRALLDTNRVLEETVRERTRELRETRLEVVHRLALAAERRDPETGQHVIRMSRYSALVAAAFGWSAEEVDLLLEASPLHDVGKIAIPDAILLKPGRLTGPELAVMQTHAQIGADLLDGGTSLLVRTSRDIALGHHERWDGKGYPQGLAAEAIPEAARICSVCDVFDAMTSRRCYHAPIPVDESVRFIVEGSGTRFDPRAVTAFSRALPDVLALRASLAREATRA